MPPDLNPSSPSRMKTSCSPCSFLTTSSKDLDHSEPASRAPGTESSVNACEVDQDLKRGFCGCACVRGRLLKRGSRCLCVSVQSCECTERRELPSLWSWTSTVTFLLATVGSTLTPFYMMQTLSFTPKTRSTMASGSQALTTPSSPRRIIYLSLRSQ